MSDHHGGFYILRDDVQLGGLVLDLVSDYLADTEQTADLNLVWFGRVGVGALLVALTSGETPDEAASRWAAQNLGLGGRIARAAQTIVWGYTYDNAVGSESVVRFGSDGSITHERTTTWDAGPARALDELSDELNAPRVLVEYDLPFSTTPFVQALQDEFDAVAFGQWLDDRAAVVWPRNADAVVLFLRKDAGEELERAADTLGVRTGSVIDAIWETCKADIFASIPLIERDHLQGPEAYLKPPPSRATALSLEPPGPTTPLDPESPKGALRLLLAPDTIREMQELALAGDRSQSYVLQKTYECGRARLMATIRARGG